MTKEELKQLSRGDEEEEEEEEEEDLSDSDFEKESEAMTERAKRDEQLIRCKCKVQILNRRLMALKEKARQLDDTIRTTPLTQIMGGGGQQQQSDEPQAKKARLIKCPVEQCKGAYRSDNGACMLCDTKVCTKCMTPYGPEDDPAAHKCCPDGQKNARFILTNTKSCPRCHVPIEKQSGCDQMMCTSCMFVFSWRTGEEERGFIHNPHYFALSPEQREAIRNTLNTGADRRLCGADQQRQLQHRFNTMLGADSTFKGLVRALGYALHVSRDGLDAMKERRGRMLEGTRDVELAGRVPRLQMLLGHKLSKPGMDRRLDDDTGEEEDGGEESHPYTEKDYETALHVSDARHRSDLERLTRRIEFAEIMTDLARAITSSQRGQREYEMGSITMTEIWRRMQKEDEKEVKPWMESADATEKEAAENHRRTLALQQHRQQQTALLQQQPHAAQRAVN